ncbi:hypothetical protein [Hyphococcus lacteus]|uniref:Uncharacterized protein n=1 Tax=Hyphococcus lacteus TaxID=3143536 RepID=A0ABV3Z4K6_9PROT
MTERQEEALPLTRPDILSPNLDAGLPPGFDINHYLAMAQEFEMSEDQKRELLLILWDIMRRFVELGFGVDSISLLGDETSQKSRTDGADVLS